jgi:hypothetical protein
MEWKSNPDYVNAAGRPKEIPVSGHRSLESILVSQGIKRQPPDVAKSLCSAGVARMKSSNVLKLSGRAALYLGTKDSVPYEPAAAFVLGAINAAVTQLSMTKSHRDLFWRVTYSDRLPRSRKKQFVSFSRARAQLLQDEMDDWLTSYEVDKVGLRKSNKVSHSGVAYFNFLQTIPIGLHSRKLP